MVVVRTPGFRSARLVNWATIRVSSASSVAHSGRTPVNPIVSTLYSISGRFTSQPRMVAFTNRSPRSFATNGSFGEPGSNTEKGSSTGSKRIHSFGPDFEELADDFGDLPNANHRPAPAATNTQTPAMVGYIHCGVGAFFPPRRVRGRSSSSSSSPTTRGLGFLTGLAGTGSSVPTTSNPGSGAGRTNADAHFGHFTVLPASLSGAVTRLEQDGHSTARGMRRFPSLDGHTVEVLLDLVRRVGGRDF